MEPQDTVFKPEFARHNQPRRIVTFGAYYPVAQVMDTTGALRYIREGGQTGYSTQSVSRREEGVRWTRWIHALNQGRQWPVKRLFDRLDPMLEADVAVAVVPSHDPFAAPPIRDLARRLAATRDRVDATSCLVRHTKIKRIVYGGPSYRGLHRQTISVENAHLIEGRRVLLLDDIAKSGASLRACEEMLYEAGARVVQSVALGRVTARDE